MFTQPHNTVSYLREHNSPAQHLELNRLLAAAVVDVNFRNRLLSDPQAALDAGYQGKYFSLDEDERDLLTSIRAQSLQDLARQLLDALHVRPIHIRQVVYVR